MPVPIFGLLLFLLLLVFAPVYAGKWACPTAAAIIDTLRAMERPGGEMAPILFIFIVPSFVLSGLLTWLLAFVASRLYGRSREVAAFLLLLAPFVFGVLPIYTVKNRSEVHTYNAYEIYEMQLKWPSRTWL